MHVVKYNVTIVERVVYALSVDADNPEQADEIAREMHEDGLSTEVDCGIDDVAVTSPGTVVVND